MVRISRTRLGKDIVAEFKPPTGNTKKVRVILLYGGVPGVPAKKELITALASRGYWVFFPRLRGSWESEGSFLRYSPEEDVYSALDALSGGFRDLWTDEAYALDPDSVFLVGSSFGGAAAVLASKDARVSASVTLSPVLDWTREGEDETIDELSSFVSRAYGGAFRGHRASWRKLKGGTFYNPYHERHTLPGEKIHIFHAEDDRVVPIQPADEFAACTGCGFTRLARGGHLGMSSLQKKFFFGRLLSILKKHHENR